MVRGTKEKHIIGIVVNLILILSTICCIVPFFMLITASFTKDSTLISKGYSIFFRDFSLEAYKMVFSQGKELINAYATTIFITVAGSLGSIALTALTAYPLSRLDYRWRNVISFYFYFTMLFSGGAVSNYILIAKYLGMKDTLSVLFVPGMLGAWNIFLLRTYFSKISISLIEAAKIDGANEYYVFFKIVLPIAKTGIATILIMVILTYWNSWYNNLMFMPKEKYVTLQYYLYKILSNVNAIQAQSSSGLGITDMSSMPRENARVAICILATAPMLFVFMCFQKYFVRGISVGGVKG